MRITVKINQQMNDRWRKVEINKNWELEVSERSTQSQTSSVIESETRERAYWRRIRWSCQTKTFEKRRSAKKNLREQQGVEKK